MIQPRPVLTENQQCARDVRPQHEQHFMKTKSLRSLIEVARFGNISRAAVALNISQPRLSQTISELEAQFGAPLFQRTGRGIVATAEGERAVALAKDILSNLAGVDAEMATLTVDAFDQISIGMPPSVCSILVPPLLSDLRTAMPHMTLRVVEGYSGVIQRALTDGEVDIGILYSIQSHSGASSDHILIEPLLLVGAVQDPMMDYFDIPLWEVAKLPLILPSKSHGLRKLVDREARRAGLTLNIILEMDALPPARDLCAAGGIYTILPSCAVSRDIALGFVKVRPIVDPDLRRKLSLHTTTARPLTGTARAAARLCVEAARRLVHAGKWLAEI
jgi:LysR family nitrogen assimilation transcriptional regulator